MPTTKKRKKKEEESKQTIGITAFLMEEEESKETTASKTVTKTKEAAEKPAASAKSVQETKAVEDVDALAEKIVDLVKKRGGLISKDDLVAWAKVRGIKLSTLMKAIEMLTQKKILVRRIVDDKFCYELRAQ